MQSVKSYGYRCNKRKHQATNTVQCMNTEPLAAAAGVAHAQNPGSDFLNTSIKFDCDLADCGLV